MSTKSSTSAAHTTPTNSNLTTRKQLLLVVLGAVFWLVAALVVRFSGEAVFSQHNPYLFLYFGLAFPGSYGFLVVAKAVVKLKPAEISTAVVIMTFTATFLDGIALTWGTELYGPTYEIALFGAAWILWGVGAGLLLGHYITHRKPNTVA